MCVCVLVEGPTQASHNKTLGLRLREERGGGGEERGGGGEERGKVKGVQTSLASLMKQLS